jgi:DNA-3-methyladenine glycosylase I
LSIIREEENGGMSNHHCAWARSNPLMQSYHDHEWGIPARDDQRLWEMLVLESFQAGLSWQTILNRRDGFRDAFDNFDANRIAAYGEDKVGALMANPAIIRSRAKIEATIANARAFLALKDREGGLSPFCWGFVGGMPILGDGATIPAKTELSETISKALKKRGFKFVGAVTTYAWMQAVGMVNDHGKNCPRRLEIVEGKI